MPQPMIWKDKCFIDFKCELQLKSRLQLDLYTEGLNRVPEFILKEEEPWGDITKPGVLVIDKNKYFNTEIAVKNKFQDIEFSSGFVKNMYRQLGGFAEMNLQFENRIAENSINFNYFAVYIEKLLDMMSLLSMQWLSFDLNIIKKITKLEADDLSIISSPLLYEPYHIRYQKSYLNVLENPSEDNLKKFISEYAFLENFEIDKNIFENTEYLKTKINEDRRELEEYRSSLKHYGDMKLKNKVRRQIMIEEILSKCSAEDYQIVYNNIILLRTCTDEEEERHYLQARAVRNIRNLLELRNMDIYSSINEIKAVLKDENN